MITGVWISTNSLSIAYQVDEEEIVEVDEAGNVTWVDNLEGDWITLRDTSNMEGES